MSGGRQLLPPVIVVLSALARTGKQGEALDLIFRTIRGEAEDAPLMIMGGVDFRAGDVGNRFSVRIVVHGND
jgi:hypothetical protein